MTEIELIISELRRAHPSMSRQLKRATEFVLKNPSQVAMHSMRRVASDAGVTPPTMLRMVKSIGFHRYEDFRDVYRNGYHYLVENFGNRARELQSRGSRKPGDSLWPDLVAANQAHLAYLMDTVRPRALKAAAQRLLAAERVYVAGMLSSFSFASYLHYIARLALPNWSLLSAPGAMLADEIATLGERDAVVAIGFAPYAADTVRLATLAHQRGASLVAITDELTSPLASQANDVFVAPNESTQFFGSYVGTVVLIESLVAYLVSLGKPDLVENIARIEGTREVFEEYWVSDRAAAET